MSNQITAKRENIILMILMVLQFIATVNFMIMMPLSAQLMVDLSIRPSEFGALVSAYALAASVSALIASSILDRFDRKYSLFLIYFGLLFGTLACGVVYSYEGLLLARMAAGIFGGVLGSIVLSIVGDLIPVERRGRATSIVMMAFSFASVAGVPMGLYIAHHLHWQWTFLSLFILGLPVLILITLFIPSMNKHIQKSPVGFWASYGQLLSVPNHWWAFLTTFFLTFSGFMVIPYIAPTLVANTQFLESHLPYFYLVGGAVTLISRPWLGRLTDRYAYAHVLAVTILFSFFPILFVTQSIDVSFIWYLILAAFFFTFVSGRFIPSTALVTASCQMQLRGRVMAFNSSVQNFSSGVAAFLAGAIMVKSSSGEILYYDWVGYISCIMGLLAAVTAYRIKRIS